MQNTPSLPQKVRTLLQLLPPDELETLAKEVPTGETPLWQYWGEFAMSFIEEKESTHVVENLRTLLRSLLRKRQILSIEQCNKPAVVTQVIKDRCKKGEKPCKNSTFNKYVRLINSYFIWLEDLEYIEVNKIRKVRTLKEEIVEIYALTDEQIQKALDYIYTRNQKPFVKRRNLLFFDLLRTTGARKCEILALSPEDIFYDKKYETWVARICRAKQKGGIDELPIPEWVGDSYLSYIEIRNVTREQEPLLFASQSNRNTGLGDQGVTYFFKKLEEDLGFEIHAKSFRAYVATSAAEKGAPTREISLYLGHKRESTTLRYIKRTPKIYQNIAKLLNDQATPTKRNQ